MTRPNPLAATLIEHQRRMVREKLTSDARLRVEREESLYDFIPRVSPRFVAPYHLAPIVELLHRMIEDGGIEACSSTPPRHVKTSTIVHALVHIAKTRPGTKLGYVTYNQQRSDAVSASARSIARRAGVTFDRDSLREWRLTNESQIVWGGIGGSWTGEGFLLVAVDDPFARREDAESPTIRDKVWDSFESDIYTRQEPGDRPTSFLVNHTRWNNDDLIGRLVARWGWRFVNLPAISDQGEALWPQGFSIERLRKIEARMGPYSFQSLYQGRPIAKGAEVFGAPTWFDALPQGVGYQVSIGGDFAYTVKTWSDFSVAIVFRRYTDGRIFVVDVIRVRCELPSFKARLRALADLHDALHAIGAFVSGTEKGGLSFFGEGRDDERVNVEAYPATSDKYMRAQPYAAAWNRGKVLLPKNIGALGELGKQWLGRKTDDGEELTEHSPVPWVEAFLDEHRNFTGVKDAFDDQIDGGAGAYEPFRMMVDDDGGGGDDDDDGELYESLTRYGAGRGY